MTQKNQIHNTQQPLFKISINIILIYTSWYTKCRIPSGFQTKFLTHFITAYRFWSSLSRACLRSADTSSLLDSNMPPPPPQHPSRSLTTTDPQTTGPIMVECIFILKSARSRQGVFQTVPHFPILSCRWCLFTEVHFCSLSGEYTAPMGAAQ
jgi:hypothetical protein